MSHTVFNTLQAVSADLQAIGVGKSDKLFANVVRFFEPTDDPVTLLSAQIVLLGVVEQAGSQGLRGIRESLYGLYFHGDRLNIVDIGDVVYSAKDEATTLEQMLAYLSRHNIFVLLVGSSLFYSKDAYKALDAYVNSISISCITPSVDFQKDGEANYLKQLISYKDQKLFDLNILGHQLYLSDPDSLEEFTANYFQTIRLGVLRNEILTAEPLLRDSDILVMDMGAIRSGDAPFSSRATPNGLYSEEVCQLARYAGISDNLKIATIVGFDLEEEKDCQTSQLIAQLVWHFTDGYLHRKNEDLLNNVNAIKKIIVNLDAPSRQLVFYHSNISERWWMEVPGACDTSGLIFACSIEDYRTACTHEVPLRWVWFHQKLLNRTI